MGGGNARRGNGLAQKDSETEQSERVSLQRWTSKSKWGRKVPMSSRKVFLHRVAGHEMSNPCGEKEGVHGWGWPAGRRRVPGGWAGCLPRETNWPGESNLRQGEKDIGVGRWRRWIQEMVTYMGVDQKQLH